VQGTSPEAVDEAGPDGPVATQPGAAGEPEQMAVAIDRPLIADLVSDAQTFSVPLILLAGIALFLAFTGRAGSETSRFADAPLRTSEPLRFPQSSR
jgi:hypothetical protein